MMPPAADPLWKRFVTGKVELNSPKLAINLLEKTVRVCYQMDAASANAQILVLKVHAFFTRYEHVFQEEFQAILR